MLTKRQPVLPFGKTYPDGHLIRAHRHDHAQLIYAVRGVMRVNTAQASWLIPPTMALWMPAGVMHAISMRGEVDMRTLYLWPRAVHAGTECRALEVSGLLRELIGHIVRTGPLSSGNPQHRNLVALLDDLLEAAPQAALSLPWPQDRRALRIAEAIVTAPGDRATMRALSQTAGASLRTLQRIFAMETGLGLEAWRQAARLLRAVELLDAGHSVTSVGLECGYGSTSAFVAAFRTRMGDTPAAYRLRRG